MRVPVKWLSEFVEIARGTTPDDIHAALVKVGFEEEDIHVFNVSGPIVVGEVLEIQPEKHSNGKTIRWCRVRVAPSGETALDGGSDLRGIVCGADNFVVGDRVVVCLPGAILPGGLVISRRETYGHVSDGMIASTHELGLGDNRDGILTLPSTGLDSDVGADALPLLGLDDSAVDVNVTPDRGYALSIRGIAREYSHATGARFRDPVLVSRESGGGAEEKSADAIRAVIDDSTPIRGEAGATVFVTRVVRGVDARRATPVWMVARLALAGIRSVSVLVDITNYVMLELGQPIHGYDLATLSGGLVVRRALGGETVTTLDDTALSLDPEDLVIADDSGPVALAGIMGGAITQMTSNTVDILIEAARYDPVSIARSARRHRLSSESSRRFERGVDPRIAQAAASRVVQLVSELAGGHSNGEGTVLEATPRENHIDLPDGFVHRLMGVDYDRDEVRSSLDAIGATLVDTPGKIVVSPPSWRPDLTDKWSLAEEVARLVGFDRIPAVLPVAPPGRGLTTSQRARRSVATVLAATGHTEVLCYPFVSSAVNDVFGDATRTGVAHVRVANPIDGEAPFLRTSLLPGLIGAARRNRSRGQTHVAVFEIGTVFRPEIGRHYGQATLPASATRPSREMLASLDASIPPHGERIGAVFVGDAIRQQPGLDAVSYSWRDAVTTVQQISLALGVSVNVRPGFHQGFHSGRTAEIFALVGGTDVSIGYAGELLPSLARDVDLPGVVGAVELDLAALCTAAAEFAAAEHDGVAPLSSHPVATQDVSLVVGHDVLAGDVRTALIDGAGPLLEEARLIGDYRGDRVERGTKSLTFALHFRASDRTLTAAEATDAKSAGVAAAHARFGASLRG